MPPSRTFFTHALNTVQTVTLTTPWYAVRSGCNQKFHCAKKLGNLHIDVSKMTQPYLMEQFAEAFEEEYDASQSRDTATEKWETLQDTIHCITLVSLGRKPQSCTTGMRPSHPEMTPIMRQSTPHSLSTSSHPLSRTYRLSGLPGARSNALPGAAPMSTGQSTVR